MSDASDDEIKNLLIKKREEMKKLEQVMAADVAEEMELEEQLKCM